MQPSGALTEALGMLHFMRRSASLAAVITQSCGPREQASNLYCTGRIGRRGSRARLVVKQEGRHRAGARVRGKGIHRAAWPRQAPCKGVPCAQATQLQHISNELISYILTQDCTPGMPMSLTLYSTHTPCDCQHVRNICGTSMKSWPDVAGLGICEHVSLLVEASDRHHSATTHMDGVLKELPNISLDTSGTTTQSSRIKAHLLWRVREVDAVAARAPEQHAAVTNGGRRQPYRQVAPHQQAVLTGVLQSATRRHQQLSLVSWQPRQHPVRLRRPLRSLAALEDPDLLWQMYYVGPLAPERGPHCSRQHFLVLPLALRPGLARGAVWFQLLTLGGLLWGAWCLAAGLQSQVPPSVHC